MRSVQIHTEVQLGGHIIHLTADVPMDPKDIDAVLDMMANRFSRQRACEQLPPAMIDLVVAKTAIEEFPERQRKMAQSRLEERVRLREKFEAEFRANGRTGPFHLKGQHKAALNQFDTDTSKKLEELAANKAKHEKAIPAMEERIAKLEAQIAGEDKLDPLRQQIKEAADD